ncbi:hypothetical protein AVEN_188284-1 [Araneus ventricosus]|uniref:Mariner Mos1 transposase n=1 Tax=Araneus ventricosus TaxID=182803 RepID=A0A4Y2LZI4_ARAVE|nr:hypothetical protein AVEN_188284-1 [Araneus ventricosus]
MPFTKNEEMSSEGRWFSFIKIMPGHMFSMMTGWALYKLEWDLMQHPPYSPGMAPLDFYLFSHLQLDGAIFNSNKVKIISFWTCTRHSSSQKGLKRWQTIVDLNGDYYLH